MEKFDAYHSYGLTPSLSDGFISLVAAMIKDNNNKKDLSQLIHVFKNRNLPQTEIYIFNSIEKSLRSRGD